jgi:hypothetical protein
MKAIVMRLIRDVTSPPPHPTQEFTDFRTWGDFEVLLPLLEGKLRGTDKNHAKRLPCNEVAVHV